MGVCVCEVLHMCECACVLKSEIFPPHCVGSFSGFQPYFSQPSLEFSLGAGSVVVVHAWGSSSRQKWGVITKPSLTHSLS